MEIDVPMEFDVLERPRPRLFCLGSPRLRRARGAMDGTSLFKSSMEPRVGLLAYINSNDPGGLKLSEVP